MNAINASELKNQGILAISAALETEPEVAITEEGKTQFIVMGIKHYQKLREYELQMALQDAKADIAAGRYVIATADDYMDKIIKEYDLQADYS